MRKIVKIRYGSHLYGTATPSSDEDWIGIFLPSARDVLLGRIPKTAESIRPSGGRKAKPGELDVQWLSLHHFLKMACQGQTMALDLLHAPPAMIELEECYPLWYHLRDNRSQFLSRNIKSFVGYARAQAARYSLKGERLNKLETFYRIVNDHALRTHGEGKLGEIWTSLPRDDERESPQHVREIQIAGKWFGETTEVSFVEDSIANAIKRYGQRAKAAAGADGIDWKALSHAVRVPLELKDLLENGEIVFPLPYADILLKVKSGEAGMQNVQTMLDVGLREVEELAAKSDLPEKVNHKKWEDWLYAAMLGDMMHTMLAEGLLEAPEE